MRGMFSSQTSGACASQDWEAQRADGLRRRLVLRRVLAAWRPLRALLQRQRERAARAPGTLGRWGPGVRCATSCKKGG